MNRIRIAAVGVGHWHSLFDAAYLKTLERMPTLSWSMPFEPRSSARKNTAIS